MIGALRAAFFGFIGLSVIYVLVSIYSRSVRRERLEKEYDAGLPEGDAPVTRDDYIAQGMAVYEHGLRKRLILLVYIIPAVVIVLTVYFVDAQ